MKYLIYSEPFLYADDLKSIVINNKEIFQLDLDNLTKWGVENRMSFAVKDLKCFIVTFRGTTEEQFYLSNLPLLGLTSAKDLGLTVTSNLSWSTHIESKIRKANTVFFFIKRNTSATQIRVRLNLYKSMLLPILSFACCCFSLSRTSLKLLENFQERVLKRVCRDYHSTHKELLLKCNLLPVSMFFQLKNLLFLSKYFHELRFTGVDLNITTTMSKKLPVLRKLALSSVSGRVDLRTNFRREWHFSNLWGSKIEFWFSCGNTFFSSILKINCAPTKYTVTVKTAETQLGYSDNNRRGEVPSA